MSDFISQEQCDELTDYRPTDADWQEYEAYLDECEDDEYDGQPDEYTEWQDLYGGDDWDHGQFDEF